MSYPSTPQEKAADEAHARQMERRYAHDPMTEQADAILREELSAPYEPAPNRSPFRPAGAYDDHYADPYGDQKDGEWLDELEGERHS